MSKGPSIPAKSSFVGQQISRVLLSHFRPMSFLLLLLAVLPAQSMAGSYESPEMSSSELQSGKRMSPYVSYQPWSYMKRAPAAPIIRFGKRSSSGLALADFGEEQPTARNIRAALNGPLIRFGKRAPSSAPLIRFGRRPADSSVPLIRFGKRSSPLRNGAPFVRFGRSWAWTGEEEADE